MIGAMAISRAEFDRFVASVVLRSGDKSQMPWADHTTTKAMGGAFTKAYRDATGDAMVYIPGEGHLNIPSRVEITRDDGETKVFLCDPDSDVVYERRD